MRHLLQIVAWIRCLSSIRIGNILHNSIKVKTPNILRSLHKINFLRLLIISKLALILNKLQTFSQTHKNRLVTISEMSVNISPIWGMKIRLKSTLKSKQAKPPYQKLQILSLVKKKKTMRMAQAEDHLWRRTNMSFRMMTLKANYLFIKLRTTQPILNSCNKSTHSISSSNTNLYLISLMLKCRNSFRETKNWSKVTSLKNSSLINQNKSSVNWLAKSNSRSLLMRHVLISPTNREKPLSKIWKSIRRYLRCTPQSLN